MSLFKDKSSIADLEAKITLLAETEKTLRTDRDEAVEQAKTASDLLGAEREKTIAIEKDAEGTSGQLLAILGGLAEAGVDLNIANIFESDVDDPETVIKSVVEEAVARQAAIITTSRGIEAPIEEAETAAAGPETQKQFWAQYNAIDDLQARNEFYKAHKKTLKQLPVG